MKFDMDSIIWLVIMIPSSTLFTGIGIFAWNRKTPMWFWSGSTVKETEISNLNFLISNFSGSICH